ncbi:hypothetical protein [Methylobacterium brachiatum]|uniref:hypothetical protein n=1 Tax=Methylobacterium brachiatum TaxID=269660 RepID=UPI0008EF2024|nr:hypothetical protein [Methylobacterium brachiatum]SFJ43244.1 hypothetical protein SAMN02799642_04390 [Methylobacterium brachiatum]
MSLIHNDCTKLSATALNGTAIASIAAGFITPLAAVSLGVPGARGALRATLFAVAWLAVGSIPRLTARPLLGSLRE